MSVDTSNSPRSAFDQIARDLAAKYADVATGQIFGTPCIKTHGKAFAAFSQDAIALKLTGQAHRDALGLEGARLWDPSGKHRPMKEWVQLPFACAREWPELAERALKYVAH
jgi:hypothetical protein